MNYKMIRFVISWVLKVEGMLMLLPALVGAMYQEKTGFAYLIWGLLCIAAGLILCFRKHQGQPSLTKRRQIRRWNRFPYCTVF